MPQESLAVRSASPQKPVNSLIEFSSESREDPNEGLNFGDAPVHCACPHCERNVVTFIDHEASWVTWVLGFVVWFSLGWMAFWVLPLLWPAFKDAVHHCPRCLNVVARKSRISLPTFRTEVMTIKIGGCAVLLARKYVVILFGLIGVILTVYVLRSTVHLDAQELPKGAPSMLTWEDFLFDCGPRTSLRSHHTSTVKSFQERYRLRTFKWQGEIRQIREGFELLFLRTKSVVLVRMYPPRFPRRDIPDVALLFGEDRNSEVGELNPGDWVEFEATMSGHGHRGDPEVMMLWKIGVVTRPSPLSSSAGSTHHDTDDHDHVNVSASGHTGFNTSDATGPLEGVRKSSAQDTAQSHESAMHIGDIDVATPDSAKFTAATNHSGPGAETLVKTGDSGQESA